MSISNHLIPVISEMNSTDSLSFEYIEKSILEKGLKQSHNDSIFIKHLELIHERNYYNELGIKQYLESLDLVYKLRTGFLAHMSNQNTISICFKDIQKNQIEIDRLKGLINEIQSQSIIS